MAMNYQNFASLGVNLNRQKYGPLDISNVFTSAADLKYYLTKGTFTEGVSEYWYKNANEKIVPYPYEGQVLATVIDGVVSVYALSLDADGNFQTQEIGAKVEVDGTTIVKDANGKLSIVAPVNPDSSKTYNFAYANGVYSWVEVDTATAAGQAQEINSLKSRASALEDTVNGTDEAEGLVAKVAALEAVDNATQAELDAYKDVVTAAIAAGVKEAKDYADAQDADTVYDDTDVKARIKAIEDDYLREADKYDDTALAARVKAIEDDYLTEADKYDDTELAGRVTTAEGKIADLEAAVEAIDYVDADELATELAPYAKTEDVNAELAKKADKTALEALQSTVDAFLTGDGTEAALDSLKELIAYIESHDDVDIAGIIEDIEAIEGKLAGVESTVVAYVTAAIDALKIGDYAKAADLTTLAGRVEALEAKPFDTYATKTEVQAVDAKFADYTTSADLATQMAAKADAASVVANDTFETFKTENTAAIEAAQSAAVAAAKTETETQVGDLADAVAETYATKAALTEAVEGIENDLLAYAKTADVEAGLAKKIETATIAHSTDEKAEGATVTGTQLDIVVDAFTKAETRQYVADTIKTMTGGESAADVKLLLENHVAAYTEKVGQIDAKDAAQDTAIATAQTQADKGVADAAKVASDLAALGVTVADNTREIGVAKSSIDTVNTTLSEKITALENADVTIKSDITTLQGVVTGEGGHASRIAALEGRATNLEARDTELAALIQGNTDKFADYYTKGEVDTKVQEAIDAIPEVDFEPYLKSEDAAATYATIAALEGIYKASEGEAAATGILAEEIARAKAAEQKIADDLALLIENPTEALDSVKELIEHVTEHGTDIAGVITRLDGHDIAIQKNVDDIAAINTALAAIVQPKASTEVTVAEDGTLGIGEVSTDKLVMGANTLVIDGGSAAV